MNFSAALWGKLIALTGFVFVITLVGISDPDILFRWFFTILVTIFTFCAGALIAIQSRMDTRDEYISRAIRERRRREYQWRS